MLKGDVESIQLVIVNRPWELQDAANITWTVAPLRTAGGAILAGAEVTVAPVGYVPAGIYVHPHTPSLAHPPPPPPFPRTKRRLYTRNQNFVTNLPIFFSN